MWATEGSLSTFNSWLTSLAQLMQTNGCFCVWKRSLVCSVPSAGSGVLFWCYDFPTEWQQHILGALKFRFLLEKQYTQIFSWIFSCLMIEIQSNVLLNWFETQTKSFQIEKWNIQAWQTCIYYFIFSMTKNKKPVFLSEKNAILWTIYYWGRKINLFH